MTEDIKIFLNDLNSRMNSTRITPGTMQKAFDKIKEEADYTARIREEEEEERARLNRLWSNQRTEEEEKITRAALREVLQPIRENIERTGVNASAFWRKINNEAQEGNKENYL